MNKKFVMLVLIMALIITTAGNYVCSADNTPTINMTVPEQIYTDQIFDVQVHLNNVQNIEGVDFSLTFDPQLVEVQDADQASAGIQITGGTFLQGLLAKNEADNPNGTIRFATATSDPGATGSGILATIKFKALQKGTSNLAFTSVKLVDQGLNWVNCNSENASLNISDQGVITGKVTMQGRAAHGGITISAYGTDTTTTTNPDGTFTLSLSPGNYTLYATAPRYISKKLGDFTITPGLSNNLQDQLLLAGDANADDKVGLDDLVVLQKDYDGSGDLNSDFNGDQKIDLIDLVLLTKNYEKDGDLTKRS